MEYTGLVQKFPVNRPLTEEERAHKLEQRKKLDIKPEHQLSVIRMNSTFLEVADVYFAWKGAGALAAIGGMLFSVAGAGLLASIPADAFETSMGRWLNVLAAILAGAACTYGFAWLARFECFRHTHYPIRFNRKTRKVHVFRVDGTVLTADWDKLFFCLGRCYRPRNWTIQGHVLAQDRKTVLETFSFPQHIAGNGGRHLLKHVWEYVRRYMDEGPALLIEQTPVVLPIANKREGFWFGWHRTHAIDSLLVLPFYLFFYPGRWIAMRTSKLPVWPPEVEAQCAIDPEDRLVRDASTNPRWAQ
jgi:hypothetical protein